MEVERAKIGWVGAEQEQGMTEYSGVERIGRLQSRSEGEEGLQK